MSKLFHALSIPRIYETINFGLPNYQKTIFEYTEHQQLLPENVQYALVQQYRFKKTLLRNPEYGSYIYLFTWTLAIKGFVGLPEWIDDEKIMKETYEFYTREAYKMFALLRNATYVYITAPGHFESLLRLSPLFPHAEHLHLGGGSQYACVGLPLPESNLVDLSSYSKWTTSSAVKHSSSSSGTETSKVGMVEEEVRVKEMDKGVCRVEALRNL